MADSSLVLARLREDHARLRVVFDRVERELACFARGEQVDYDILAGALHVLSNYLNAVHHPLENHIIERLRRRQPGVADPAPGLERSYQELEALTAQVGWLFAAARDDAIAPRAVLCGRMQCLLREHREHMHWEETSLFPAADRLLTAEDWTAVISGTGVHAAESVGVWSVAGRFASLVASLAPGKTG